MILLLALAAAAQEPPDVAPVPAPVEPHTCWSVGAAAGIEAWSHGGFETLAVAGRREIESDLLPSATLELLVGWRGWDLGVGAALGEGDDLQSRLGWVRLAPPAFLDGGEALPVQLRGSVGIVGGTVDVDVSGFGDFETSLGAFARLSVETRPSAAAFAAWADVRALEFDYDEPTLSGDDALGGTTFALGLSVGLRF
jgi:hypothetical protein